MRIVHPHERYMDENMEELDMDIEMQASTHCTVTISYIHSFYGLMDFVFLWHKNIITRLVFTISDNIFVFDYTWCADSEQHN